MTELENQIKFNMELRCYSPKTIKNYLICINNFAKHYNMPLELLGNNEVKNYLHYCITEKHLCEGTVNYIYSALMFFYTKTLDREWKTEKITRVKNARKLPVVLSQSEVKAILEVTKNLKHKAILSTIYGAGLRLSEAAKLKVTDIDSKNMQINIRQGKGKKDRYSLLSETNLKLLRDYWRRYKPKTALFSGNYPNEYISRTIQKVFGQSKNKAGIKKEATVDTLRHYVELNIMVSDLVEPLNHKDSTLKLSP